MAPWVLPQEDLWILVIADFSVDKTKFDIIDAKPMALRGGGWILLTAVVVLSFSAVNSVSTLDELAGLAPYPEEVIAAHF